MLLRKLLTDDPRWDKKDAALVVSNATDRALELRATFSAADAAAAWELKVKVREHLVEFVRENYPDALPKSRIIVQMDGNGGVWPEEKFR